MKDAQFYTLNKKGFGIFWQYQSLIFYGKIAMQICIATYCLLLTVKSTYVDVDCETQNTKWLTNL